MRILVLTVFFVTTAFDFFLKFLTYSKRNDPLPENVRDVFDEETYKKNQAYSMEKLRFSIIIGIVGTILSSLFLILNFHHAVYEFILQYTVNVYLTSLSVFLVPILIAYVISVFAGIYQTFIIEARYGFNKTTPMTFLLDFAKNLSIAVVVSSGLLSLFVYMHRQMGDWVFLAFFFVLLATILFTAFISPLLIRIYNKLTPLGDGELKSKIEVLAKDAGYKLIGIYMVDASRRSTKLNAFTSGFGKTRTIGLYDTLESRMTTDEIVSVLAHEIGHAKKHHILKRFPLTFLVLSIVLIASYFIITLPEASQAFGFTEANIAFGIYVMSILVSPLLTVLYIPINAQSRKHEYEADYYEMDHSGKDIAISAIKKLYRESFGNLTPHPFVVLMEHSHPTLTQRVAAFERRDNEA